MFTEFSRGGKQLPHSYAVFICDNSSELSNLPTTKARSSDGKYDACCYGSKAYVFAEQKTYMLNHSDEWVPGSIGESTLDSSSIATIDDARGYLGI